jgi:hypothetical protein
LTEDAGVSTDLNIQPGQRVIISADAGLAEAPRWGSGDFRLAEMLSLAVRYLAIAGQVEALEQNHGAKLYKMDCKLTSGRIGPDDHTALELRDAQVKIIRTDLGGRGLWSIGGSVIINGCIFGEPQFAAHMQLQDQSNVVMMRTDLTGFTVGVDLAPGSVLTVNGCTFSDEDQGILLERSFNLS